MSLSRHERSILEWYRASRAEPPTFAALVVRQLPRLFAFTVGIAAVCAFEWGRDREAAFLVIGIFIGVVVERLLRFREVARAWPVVAGVLDFDRINALLDADLTDEPPAT